MKYKFADGTPIECDYCDSQAIQKIVNRKRSAGIDIGDIQYFCEKHKVIR